MCFPALSEPVNLFLGHTVTTYEETGCGNVSESTGCHSVVTLSR